MSVLEGWIETLWVCNTCEAETVAAAKAIDWDEDVPIIFLRNSSWDFCDGVDCEGRPTARQEEAMMDVVCREAMKGVE